MPSKAQIEFDQLVHLARKLPKKRWAELKAAVEKPQPAVDKDLIEFLLSAPTFTDEQLSAIADARESLSRWRAV
jgi:hypothetical protein